MIEGGDFLNGNFLTRGFVQGRTVQEMGQQCLCRRPEVSLTKQHHKRLRQ